MSALSVSCSTDEACILMMDSDIQQLFVEGSAAACRLAVQQLNAKRGEIEEAIEYDVFLLASMLLIDINGAKI